MEVNTNKDSVNIILNNHEIDIFYNILSNAYIYQNEYGTMSNEDVLTREMIDELWGKLKVITNEQ